MVRLPDVVRAPPEKVWQALLDPGTRTMDPRLASEARGEGQSFHYTRKGRSWVENVLESDAPRRLVLERREGDVATARLEWTLHPIDLGTLLVLDVKGTSFQETVRQSYLMRPFYRRAILAIKRRTETPPPSRLDLPSPEAAPLPEAAPPTEATPAPQGPAPAEPEPAPAPKRAPRRKKK